MFQSVSCKGRDGCTADLQINLFGFPQASFVFVILCGKEVKRKVS